MIKTLPDILVSKIAAGEVIERPASVIKELVENSIDASATSITIDIAKYGKQLIRVSDNGYGMAEEDAKICFHRHTTSKLSDFDDLYHINSYGFRGEALASIASVGQVNLKTKAAKSEIGTEITIFGGEIKNIQPVGMRNGTSITVENLFFNIPVRAKFLKSDATELYHIFRTVQISALSAPSIHLKFNNNQQKVYGLTSQSLKERIISLFGKNYTQNLIEIKESSSWISVEGCISDPNTAKKTKKEQFIMVNGRYVYFPLVQCAIMSAYQHWLEERSYPLYIINIIIDLDQVDVNVHPQKIGVRFKDERAVVEFVKAAVQKTLNRYYNVAFYKQNENKKDPLSIPTLLREPVKSDPPTLERNLQAPSPPKHIYIPSRINRIKTSKISSSKNEDSSQLSYKIPSKTIDIFKNKKEISHTWIAHKQFIFTQTLKGISVINMISALQRIQYERSLEGLKSGITPSQQLLFPIILNISASEYVIIQKHLLHLKKIGFNVDCLSGYSISIHSVPIDWHSKSVEPYFYRFIKEFLQWDSILTAPIEEKIAKAFVRTIEYKSLPRLTTPEQIEQMIDSLFQCQNYDYDPFGKPIIRHISLDKMKLWFRSKKELS